MTDTDDDHRAADVTFGGCGDPGCPTADHVVEEDQPEISLRSARESMRWLLRQTTAWFDQRGLHIERGPHLGDLALDVDEVLERLAVLDVPASIAICRRPRGTGYQAYVEVQVSFDDLHLLAKHLPQVNDIVKHVRPAT